MERGEGKASAGSRGEFGAEKNLSKALRKDTPGGGKWYEGADSEKAGV